MLNKIYFTIAGMNFRYGTEFAERGMAVTLEKDPKNEYDKEAIKVTIEGLGHIGYVANNPYTVVGERMSAGRLYDKIGDEATAKVAYNMGDAVQCLIEV